MTVYQLNYFGMCCVDFYFKVLSIFMLFSRSSQKRSRFELRVAAVIPALLLYCFLLVQIPHFNPEDLYLFMLYVLLFVGLFLTGRFLYDASAYTILFNMLGGLRRSNVARTVAALHFSLSQL